MGKFERRRLAPPVAWTAANFPTSDRQGWHSGFLLYFPGIFLITADRGLINRVTFDRGCVPRSVRGFRSRLASILDRRVKRTEQNGPPSRVSSLCKQRRLNKTPRGRIKAVFLNGRFASNVELRRSRAKECRPRTRQASPSPRPRPRSLSSPRIIAGGYRQEPETLAEKAFNLRKRAVTSAPGILTLYRRCLRAGSRTAISYRPSASFCIYLWQKCTIGDANLVYKMQFGGNRQRAVNVTHL